MELINIEKEEEKINMMAPLTWAYIGDAVFELYIRTYLINKTNLKPHKLHVEAIKYVKAPAQAKALQKIEEMLTDKEKEIVKIPQAVINTMSDLEKIIYGISP